MIGKRAAIIGGGPAGLMAAEVLSAAGVSVTVFEAMPTVGRKFLLAGKSGLNITHSEPFEAFTERFGPASMRLRKALDTFGPAEVRQWAADLGSETFVGTSGRVFPKAMKASPLLRAWIARLESRGVVIIRRHRWAGWNGSGLDFETPDGRETHHFDAVLLALGGASWPRLGSDAAWIPLLRERGIAIADLKPANCGFDANWSDAFRERSAGEPVKSVVVRSGAGVTQGEFVISRHGVEGSLIYAHAAALRDGIEKNGTATLECDLVPGRTLKRLVHDLDGQDAKTSLSNRLRKAAGLSGAKAALVREIAPEAARLDPGQLGLLLKALPIVLVRPRPIAEAISSAGGIRWDGIEEGYMLKALPGIFVAGEMLDWEAPTGGYLLTACFATGRAAAFGMIDWLR